MNPTAKFAGLLTDCLRKASLATPASTSDDVAPVELAVVYPMALRDGPSPTVAEIFARLPAVTNPVADAFGHRRPVYRPLLNYSVARAVRLIGSGHQAACAGDGRPIAWTAARGERAGYAAWSWLAAFAAAQDRPGQAACVSAAAFFESMRAAQQPGGAWLAAGGSDNIETLGYDELVLLHAMQSFAALSGRRDFAATIAANAAFQMRELQPDHATTQPWALHALAATPATLPLAEQLLHAAASQQPQGFTGLPVVLIADALYGLRRS